MYQIPLIFWMSTNYRDNFDLDLPKKIIENRKYLMDDFIHTFAQFTQIKYGGYKAKKSVLSQQFIQKKRLIKHGVDYDALP